MRFYSDNFDILAFLLGSTKEPQKKLAKMLRETSSTKCFPFEHVEESKGNEQPDSQKWPRRACHQFTQSARMCEKWPQTLPLPET